MVEKSNLKASLKVQLLANDVLVAESDDPVLWQHILAAVHSGGVLASNDLPSYQHAPPPPPPPKQHVPPPPPAQQDQSAISDFARDIGVSVEEIIGACRPGNDQPFIHLDDHCWEAFKKNIPARGKNSVAPIALSAALLILWFKCSKVGEIPTVKQCQDVLNTIHMADKNVGRSIKNTEWLQKRGNNVIINPAMRSKAVSLVKAYCTLQSLGDSVM